MLIRLKPTNSPQMPPKLPENRKKKSTSEGMKTAAAVAALRAHKLPNFKHSMNRIINCASYNIVSVFKTSLIDDFKVITPSASTDLLTYLLTYLLTPCSRVPLEKPTGSAASQEILRTFYGTRKFITVHTSARHLSLS